MRGQEARAATEARYGSKCMHRSICILASTLRWGSSRYLALLLLLLLRAASLSLARVFRRCGVVTENARPRGNTEYVCSAVATRCCSREAASVRKRARGREGTHGRYVTILAKWIRRGRRRCRGKEEAARSAKVARRASLGSRDKKSRGWGT